MIARHLASDAGRGIETLRAHKLRSLLTMLGIIFGVAAVVSMMSIGAGAQETVLSLIEQLGVRNVIVEAREVTDYEQLQQVRRVSAGLSQRDLRVIRTNVPGLAFTSMRKHFNPQKLVPRPNGEAPQVYGIETSYRTISGLEVATGRFLDEDDVAHAAPVCVLGEQAARALFGTGSALGRHVKVNEQWFTVVGTVAPQVSAETDVPGIPAQDRNNLIYVPVTSALLRLEDSHSRERDEIDGLYLQFANANDVTVGSEIVRGVLAGTHRGADDYSLIVPAQLLAEQQRTQRIFDFVMVALASISLLVGGIGIMNIMLASVLERTREIGVRRAVGARQADIVRQFLLETVMISVLGGLIGLVVGVGLSRLIAVLAGWSTIITLQSILLAFLVSVGIGLIFGVYPARRAARLDPVEALHYE